MKGFWLVMLLAVSSCSHAFARDLGQWEGSDPDLKKWFENLKRPDDPKASCCGEADAYWADSFEVQGDKYVAIVTDTRPDEPLGRPPLAVGTRFIIPADKIKFDQGNPTGHGIIFVNAEYGYIYCYLPPGGV
jgi:hypothetical protein